MQRRLSDALSWERNRVAGQLFNKKKEFPLSGLKYISQQKILGVDPMGG